MGNGRTLQEEQIKKAMEANGAVTGSQAPKVENVENPAPAPDNGAVPAGDTNVLGGYDAMLNQLNKDEETTLKEMGKVYDEQAGGYERLWNEVDTKRKGLMAQDKEMERRNKAYRYIVGVGDAVSGLANLVGTAHGAANQVQYENAPEIIQKAEAARQQRKLEIDKINARLDELRQQKDAVMSAKGLKEAEIKASYANQRMNLGLSKQKAKEQEDLASQRTEGQKEVERLKGDIRMYIEGSKKKGSTGTKYKDTAQWEKFTDSSGNQFKVDAKRMKSSVIKNAVLNQLNKELATVEKTADGKVIGDGEYFSADELNFYRKLFSLMQDSTESATAENALGYLIDAHMQDGYVGDYIKSLGLSAGSVEELFADLK